MSRDYTKKIWNVLFRKGLCRKLEKDLEFMKVLVTGGAGFVGTNLIKRLLKDGHEVVSVDNYSTGLRKNEQEGCVYHDIDISKTSLNYLSWINPDII